jgi:hypothetical protein
MSADVAWETDLSRNSKASGFCIQLYYISELKSFDPYVKILQFIEENTDARMSISCEKLLFFICILLTAVVPHIKISLCIRPL